MGEVDGDVDPGQVDRVVDVVRRSQLEVAGRLNGAHDL
jgi:hypothetical protein